MAGRIRIRLKAFDHALIDQAAADAKNAIEQIIDKATRAKKEISKK